MASAFRTGSRFRRARAFHPVGVAFRATVHVDAGGPAEPALPVGSHSAIVRFSRGIGWSRALPDIHGVAVRLHDLHGPGRHQDLLLSSVLSAGVGRLLPWPSATVSGPFYSIAAPYGGPQGATSIGARFEGPTITGLGALEDAIWSGRCTLRLSCALGLKGWTPIGRIQVHADQLTDAEEEPIGFDPWNTADDFQPAGWVNRLRRPAYAASRQGRASAGRGVASAGGAGSRGGSPAGGEIPLDRGPSPVEGAPSVPPADRPGP